MKQADHNKTFTAADIQRYHAGELSMQERHALEKAALDDPFLADALEGYQHTATPQIDLAALEQRLAEKTTPRHRRRLFVAIPWVRAAALFLLLAGAGWAVYQFAFINKEELALTPTVTTKQQEQPAAATLPAEPMADSAAAIPMRTKAAPVQESVPQVQMPLVAKPSTKQVPIQDNTQTDEARQIAAPTAVASAPTENKLSIKDADMAARKETTAPYTAFTENQPLHTFKGQILDMQGNPVPNASITVNGKPIGTTTNLQGKFSLKAQDSVINATVSAVGFEMNRLSLKDPAEEKTVVLNETSAALNEVVVTGYGKKRAKNTRPSAAHTKAEVEALEPKNGWSSYNSYIAENLQIPEEVAAKQIKGEVELSFEVNNEGEPVNIRVEKSLCASCDKEAIRLLQEGPGWKKKKKKSGGKIRIRF